MRLPGYGWWALWSLPARVRRLEEAMSDVQTDQQRIDSITARLTTDQQALAGSVTQLTADFSAQAAEIAALKAEHPGIDLTALEAATDKVEGSISGVVGAVEGTGVPVAPAPTDGQSATTG